MSPQWRFIVRLNEQLHSLRRAEEIQEVGSRLVSEHLNATRVSYSFIDGDDIVDRGVDEGQPFTGRGATAEFGKTIVDACRHGQTVVVDDVLADPRLTEVERTQLTARATAALVAVPLIKDDRWIAMFGVHSDTTRHWTPDQIALVEVTAERIWLLGERARIEEALSRSESRQAFFRRLSDAVRPLADPARILAEACRLLGTHLRVNRAVYGEIDGDDCIMCDGYVDGVAPLPRRFPWRHLANSRMPDILKGGTLTSDDTSGEGHAPEERPQLRAAGIGAYICPLLVKDGRFVAAFGIHSRLPRVWTPDEIALVEEVADRIWGTLEHRRAEAELRENQNRLAFLLQLNDALRPLSDATAVQETAARLLGNHLCAGRVGYAEIDGQRYVVRCEYTRDLPPLAGPGPTTTFGAGLLDAYMRGETVVVNDVAAETRLAAAERAAMLEQQVAAYVGVRLIKGGRPVAAFGASHPTPRIWTPTEVALVRDVAERTWDAVERARAERAAYENDRRQTEEAIQTRRDEEHARELRLLLETATQGIVSIDEQGVIVTANRAFELMFGWPPGELIGQSIDQLVPSGFREAHARHRANYFAAARPRMMGGRLLLTGERRDGSTFPIEVSLNHVPSSISGRAFAFITDITERHRAAEALQQRTEELEERTKQLSQMAWDLTLAEHHAREQIAKTLHDGLQQQLVIVALNLDVHLKRDAETGGGADAVLLDAKRHLDEAIDAARSLSRELFPPVLHRSGLPAALKWLANSMREKYNLDVDVVANPLADSARSDLRTLLYESASELLFNAVKHARVDRVRLDLALEPDDQLCLTVTDRGVGFEPASLDDGWKTGEIGWGLFSIRERLTLLGGRCDVESAPGRGTRVRLRAPRGAARPTPAAVPHAVSPPPVLTSAADAAASEEALRILIVDDHAAVRGALRQMLHERRQLRVVGEATDGIDAIVQARQLRPDVILMDVMMPHMDGIEATARIHAELPDTQILGLSMQARSETVHAIEEAGAAGFFVKGLDTRRLLDRLLLLHASRAAAR
jgi:PAS domain S-box-containing protein